VDFVGGILTAVIAFFLMIHINARMTLLTFCIMAVFGLILQRAFKTSGRSSANAPRSTPR